MSSGSNRRRRTGLAGLFGVAAVMTMAISASLAFHVGSVGFELDGNTDADAAAAGVDWEEIFSASGGTIGTIPAAIGAQLDADFVKDFVVGASGPDPSYHEPSIKDNQPVSATGGSEVWGCVSARNPTDKDDILNAYALAYTGAAGGEDAGDLIVDFGVERFDDSGTAYLGFWLFQADVSCNLTTAKFEGTKTNNDILLLVNFSNGGSAVTINAFAWHPGTPAASAAGTFTTIGTGVRCDLTTDNNGAPLPGGTNADMCAITNGPAIAGGVGQNVGVPWPMEDKQKPGAPSPDDLLILEPPEFVEGAINLTDAFAAKGQTPPACFGSFMAETRSSDTLSATLKDFALGDLNTCDARVKITPTETNRVGEKHTFVVDVEKNTGAGFVPTTTGDVSFTLVGSNGIAASVPIIAAESTCDDDQDAGPAEDHLDAAGQCTITINSAVAGKVTANASVAVDLGGGSVLVRDTSPATTTIGDGYAGSAPAVKTYVDATIDITGDGTNRVGASHSFTATVKANAGDGAGFVAVSGQLVTITKTDANGAVSDPAGSQTCTTAATGLCSVTFTSNSTGTTTGAASATVTVGGLQFSINTADDAATVGNESVLKTWVDAEIDITGDGDNRVGAAHVFTVTVKTDDGGTAGLVAKASQVVTVTLANSNGGLAVVDNDPDTDSTCDDGTDANGQCIVTFGSASTGITTGTASASVTVNGITFTINTTTDASIAANQDATKNWVNARVGIAGTDTNSIGEEHTFTVTLQKDTEADGAYIAANGEQVTVTLADAAGAVHILDTTKTTCDVAAPDSFDGAGTSGSGQCVVVFTSNTAGTVTGSASSTLTVTNVQMTVTTGDATSQTGTTVVKTFVDGSLKWLKHDHNGALLGGATFEVCRTHRLDTSTSTYVLDAGSAAVRCFTVFDAADGTATSPDTDVTGGELEVIDLILGRYTVKETIPPAGYSIKTPPGAGPFTFPDMTIAAPNVTLGTIFVNERLFRLIVLTCNDITLELVDSTVTLEGVDKQTILDVPAVLATLGVTEAQLCNLGGAQYNGLDQGTYDPSVELPDLAPLFSPI